MIFAVANTTHTSSNSGGKRRAFKTRERAGSVDYGLKPRIKSVLELLVTKLASSARKQRRTNERTRGEGGREQSEGLSAGGTVTMRTTSFITDIGIVQHKFTKVKLYLESLEFWPEGHLR